MCADIAVGHYKTEAALQRACQVVTGRNPFALNQILLDVEQSLSETEEGRLSNNTAAIAILLPYLVYGLFFCSN